MLLEEGSKYRYNLRSENDPISDDVVFGYKPYRHAANGGHARISSGVKTKDSNGNIRPQDKRNENIEKLVNNLYKNLTQDRPKDGIAIKSGDIIIPAYNSNGTAEYTKIISDKLTEKLLQNDISVNVIDCLSIDPREQQRLKTKKEGTSVKVGNIDDVRVDTAQLQNIPSDARIWIFDNVANKGKTYNTIVLALRDEGISNLICPLVYTLSLYSKIYYKEELNAYLIDRRDQTPMQKSTYILAKAENGEIRAFVDCNVPDNPEYRYKSKEEISTIEEGDDIGDIDNEAISIGDVCIRPEFKSRYTYRVSVRYTKVYNGKIYIQDNVAYRYGYEADYEEESLKACLDGTTTSDISTAYENFENYKTDNKFSEYNEYEPEIDRLKVAKEELQSRKSAFARLESKKDLFIKEASANLASWLRAHRTLTSIFGFYNDIVNSNELPKKYEDMLKAFVSDIIRKSPVYNNLSGGVLSSEEIVDLYRAYAWDAVKEAIPALSKVFGPEAQEINRAHTEWVEKTRAEAYRRSQAELKNKIFEYASDRDIFSGVVDFDGSESDLDRYLAKISNQFQYTLWGVVKIEELEEIYKKACRITSFEKEKARSELELRKQQARTLKAELKSTTMADLREYLEGAEENDEKTKSDIEELKNIVELYAPDVRKRLRWMFNPKEDPTGLFAKLRPSFFLPLNGKYKYPKEPGPLLKILPKLINSELEFRKKFSKQYTSVDFMSYYWALIALVEDYKQTGYAGPND